MSLDLPPPPWIVGHRGAAGSALENTLSSLGLAVDEGVDMVEVDFQLSADEQPVLFHDWDLRRLAGRSETVERTPLAELLAIELPDPDSGTAQRIATLEQALAILPPEMPLNLEIKRRFHPAARLASVLVDILPSDRRILVSSFDWNLLREIRRLLPQLPLAPLGRYKSKELVDAAIQLDAFSLHAHRELVPEILELPEALLRPLLAYTVNEAAEARELFARGVAGVFTDVPASLRSSISR